MQCKYLADAAMSLDEIYGGLLRMCLKTFNACSVSSKTTKLEQVDDAWYWTYLDIVTQFLKQEIKKKKKNQIHLLFSGMLPPDG